VTYSDAGPLAFGARGPGRQSHSIVGVVSELIERALETDVYSPCSKFVLPGSRVAGDTGGVFLALAGMKAGAN